MWTPPNKTFACDCRWLSWMASVSAPPTRQTADGVHTRAGLVGPSVLHSPPALPFFRCDAPPQYLICVPQPMALDGEALPCRGSARTREGGDMAPLRREIRSAPSGSQSHRALISATQRPAPVAAWVEPLNAGGEAQLSAREPKPPSRSREASSMSRADGATASYRCAAHTRPF